MSGYVIVFGVCVGCQHVLGFNPHKVPSANGEPICASCVARYQAYQREHGLPVWPDPLPGAYEEMPEEEL